MRVLLAFDKFKDAMSAANACHSAATGIKEIHPDWEIIQAPMTDGGEGFAEILANACGGTLETVEVHGARLQPTQAKLGWVEIRSLPAEVVTMLKVPASGKLAIVEMAQASGIEALSPEERDPWQTTTLGTGRLIRHAAEKGAAAILLGLGGSATNDLGVGALEGLGLQAYNRNLEPVTPIVPSRWREINSLGGIVNVRDQIPPIRIACDVSNPLLGPKGATAVFGPQKGLKAADYERLERQAVKMADRLLGLFGHAPEKFAERREEPGSGAAGGTGFGLRTAIPDSEYVPGFELVSAWLGLESALKSADIVITGEGCFDQSSLGGKGPATILKQLSDGQKCYVFAGKVTPEAMQALEKFPSVAGAISITPDRMALPEALEKSRELLREAVEKTLLESTSI